MSRPALAPETRAWLAGLGIEPKDPALWLEALTHGSTGADANYERLEFLGDRVLGLSVADWLYRNEDGPEGKLSQRLNALVSREMCAEIARSIGLPTHIQLGKQAREDGGGDSDNILGDVLEALLGASFTERGFDETRALVWSVWSEALASHAGHRKHPKSALQEWAAGNRRKMPHYAVVERSGPDHAAKFTVKVSITGVGEVSAQGTSKQDAETEAAAAFMEKFG
ncbi:MAG TPA: ribonuclease III [Croceibacterium sp.]|nr:ribonuclease III [Croceibacterium sp.]